MAFARFGMVRFQEQQSLLQADSTPFQTEQFTRTATGIECQANEMCQMLRLRFAFSGLNESLGLFPGDPACPPLFFLELSSFCYIGVWSKNPSVLDINMLAPIVGVTN